MDACDENAADGGADAAPSRLERAFAAFMEFDGDAGDSDAKAAYLARHADLRNLLEPMLDGENAEGHDEAVAEAFVRGRVLDDRFRLIRKVGAGGMGVVWEARQIALDRRVAVKVLSTSLAFSPRAIARFRRESLVMAKLDHPGIARVLAVGQERDALWFAMEFVDGGALDEAIASDGFEGPEGVRRAVTIALRVAQALDHAHAAGVVHRDVKPANVLLRGPEAPVLTDFGLAHEGGLPSMTMTGAFAGTPQYVSPEQVEGGDVDARTDVFSLGATLYECLAGRPPFDGPVVHEILRNIQQRDPADLRRSRADIGADLAAVVGRALEKRPSNRYPNARAFAQDLQAVLDGRPVQARPVGATTRILRAARREPLKASLLAAVAASIPVVAGLGGYLLANRETIETGERVLETRRYEALLASAMGVRASEDPTESGRLLREAATLVESPVEPVTLLAVLHLRAGRAAEAAALREEFAELWSRDPVFRRVDDYIVDETYRLRGPDRAETPPQRGVVPPAHEPIELLVEGMLSSGGSHLEGRQQDAQRAFAYFQRALDASPRARLHQHLLWVSAMARLGDAARTRQAVAAIEALWPEEPRAANTLGFALSFGDPEAAIPYFERSLVTDGEQPLTCTNLAICHRKCGREEEAERWMQRACASDPVHLGSCGVYAGFLIARRRFEEAETMLARGLAAAPESPKLLAQRVDLALAAGERSVAEEFAERALAADPLNPRILINAAGFAMERGDVDGAIDRLRDVCAHAPGWHMPWVNLAVCLQQQGDYEPAVDALRRACSLRPEDTGLTLRLAQAQMKVDVHAARRTLEEVLDEIGPDGPERAQVLYLLGLAYADCRMRTAAARTFLELLEVEPNRLPELRESVARNETSDDDARRGRAVSMARAARGHDGGRFRWAHEALVRVARTEQEHDAVRAELRAWVARCPDEALGWLELAEHLVDETLPDSYRSRDAARAALARAEACFLAAGGEPSARLLAVRARLSD